MLISVKIGFWNYLMVAYAQLVSAFLKTHILSSRQAADKDLKPLFENGKEKVDTHVLNRIIVIIERLDKNKYFARYFWNRLYRNFLLQDVIKPSMSELQCRPQSPCLSCYANNKSQSFDFFLCKYKEINDEGHCVGQIVSWWLTSCFSTWRGWLLSIEGNNGDSRIE